MFRLVLIDDEPLVRQGLSSMIQRLCTHWEIVGSASTGEEGIAQLESLKPDVAIVDVRMPGMSGLEMIEQSVICGLQISFVVLSGYGEFQYVQRAMRIGVNDYLLKPVKRNELIAILSKLETRLSQEREQASKHIQLVRYKQESELRIREQIIDKLIQGELLTPEQQSIIEESGYYFDRNPYIVLRMEINPESLIGKAKSRRDEQLYQLFFHQVISELIQEYGNSIVSPGEDGSLTIILFFASDLTYSVELVGLLSSKIKKVVLEYSKLDVNIGVSSLLVGMIQVRTAYAQALHSITNSAVDNPVLKTIEYIQQHFYEKLSLEEVAARVHLHPTYLSELFYKKTGVHFSDYVNRVRLQEAKRMLRDTFVKIEEVSERSGFLSYRHFTRVFRKEEGISPSVYRKRFFN